MQDNLYFRLSNAGKLKGISLVNPPAQDRAEITRLKNPHYNKSLLGLRINVEAA